MTQVKTKARYAVARRPATIRADGSLCTFRHGVVDTDTGMIVYVADRDACRRLAKSLETDPEARRISDALVADRRTEHYPLHAAYADEAAYVDAVVAHDAGSCYCADGEAV